jgi:hypothetical protein
MFNTLILDVHFYLFYNKKNSIIRQQGLEYCKLVWALRPLYELDLPYIDERSVFGKALSPILVGRRSSVSRQEKEKRKVRRSFDYLAVLPQATHNSLLHFPPNSPTWNKQQRPQPRTATLPRSIHTCDLCLRSLRPPDADVATRAHMELWHPVVRQVVPMFVTQNQSRSYQSMTGHSVVASLHIPKVKVKLSLYLITPWRRMGDWM